MWSSQLRNKHTWSASVEVLVETGTCILPMKMLQSILDMEDEVPTDQLLLYFHFPAPQWKMMMTIVQVREN